MLSTLATYSNTNANTGFRQVSFDVTSYKGQTIQIYLVGAEDSTKQTSFVVDDFALNATTPTGGGDTARCPDQKLWRDSALNARYVFQYKRQYRIPAGLL